MATPIIVAAYKAPRALLMLVTSAIDWQAWEHGDMWHVAGGGCLYKFILNWTFYLEVDLFSAWGQADMVTRSNHSWVVFQFWFLWLLISSKEFLSNGGMLLNSKSLQLTHLSSNVHGTEHAFIRHVHFTIMTIFILVKLGQYTSSLCKSLFWLVWERVKASTGEPDSSLWVFSQCISNMSLMENLNTSKANSYLINLSLCSLLQALEIFDLNLHYSQKMSSHSINFSLSQSLCHQLAALCFKNSPAAFHLILVSGACDCVCAASPLHHGQQQFLRCTTWIVV